jgi:hypothetical protein
MSVSGGMSAINAGPDLADRRPSSGFAPPTSGRPVRFAVRLDGRPPCDGQGFGVDPGVLAYIFTFG